MEDITPAERHLEQFGLYMLSSLLLATPTAPLSPTLLDPNIGSCYAPPTGYDNSPTESTFSFGLPRVLSLVNTTLAQVAHAGCPSDRIEASIHQTEHVRSIFGIGILMKTIPYWSQHYDLVETLHVNRLIQPASLLT